MDAWNVVCMLFDTGDLHLSLLDELSPCWLGCLQKVSVIIGKHGARCACGASTAVPYAVWSSLRLWQAFWALSSTLE